MTSLQNSSYEDDLERIIKVFGNRYISRALRLLIHDLYHNEAAVADSFAQPKLVRNKISTLEGNTRLKPYDLRGIVSEQITTHLISEEDRNKAEVVFKYLSSYYSGNRYLSLEDITQGVEDIRSGQRFTVPDDSNKKEGKDDGKYKALANLFISESVESNDHTLKFGIAVLGIKVSNLEELLNQLLTEEHTDSSDSPSKKSTNENEKNPHKSFFSSKLKRTITITLLLIGGIIIYRYFNSTPTPLVEKIPANREIKSSDLFVEPFDLKGIETPEGSLRIEIMKVIKNDILINHDTVGLEKVWVRFRITNLTEESYFPDVIFIRFIQSASLDGEINKTVIPTEPEANVRFEIPEQPNLIFWNILSVNDFSIPENSQVYGIFEVTSSFTRPPSILEFKLGVSLYSGGNNVELESAENFRIGFSM